MVDSLQNFRNDQYLNYICQNNIVSKKVKTITYIDYLPERRERFLISIHLILTYIITANYFGVNSFTFDSPKDILYFDSEKKSLHIVQFIKKPILLVNYNA